MSLGEAHLERGDLAAARRALDEALVEGEAADSAYNRGFAHRALGALALAEGRHADAVRHFEATRAELSAHYEATYPGVIAADIEAAYARGRRGASPEALAAAAVALGEILPRAREILGASSAQTALAARRLGELWRRAGQPERGIPQLRDAHRILAETQHAESTAPALAAIELGLALEAHGEAAEARPLLEGAVARLERLGRGHLAAAAEARRALDG
jgi:tetratricopeptide (TPR) repeat protein